MTISEAQTYLAAHGLETTPETLRRWIKTGKLAGQKVNRRYQVTQAALDDLLSADAPETAAHKPAAETVVISRQKTFKRLKKAAVAQAQQESLKQYLDTAIFGKSIYRTRMKLAAKLADEKVELPAIGLSIKRPKELQATPAAVADLLIDYAQNQAL